MPGDIHFNDVTLLLHCDGADASTTFTDNSNSGHTITANGSAQIDTAVSKFGGASAIFDSTSDDFITAPASPDFAFGTGDFTIDFWMKTNASATDPDGGGRRLFKLHSTDGNTTSNLQILIESSNRIQIFTNAAKLTGTSTVNDDSQHFVEISREGGTIRIFVDGVLENSTTLSDAFSPNSGSPSPSFGGRRNATDGMYTGHIDDIRITKGTGRHTIGYLVPVEAHPDFQSIEEGDEFFDDVKLLVHCEGADASTSFFDSSSSEHTLSVVANAQVDTARAKWGVSSALFDGSGDYISVANSAEFNFGANDFTIEGWVYPTTSNHGTYLMGCQRTLNHLLLFGTTYSTIRLILNNADAISGITVVGDVWQHIAVVRSGTDLFVMVNGVQQGSTYNIGVGLIDCSSAFSFGGSSQAVTHTLFGSLDEIRVTTDQARYTTTAFTPPIRAFSDFKKATVGDDDFDSTVLLINADGYDTQSGFIDQSRSEHVLTSVGNVQVDTTIKRRGTGSMEFDGTGDYVTFPDSADFNFGADNFTIEFSIHPDSAVGAWARLYENSAFDSATLGHQLSFNGSDAAGSRRLGFQLSNSGGGGARMESNAAISTSQFTEIAIVREGTTIYMYVDGVQQTATINIGTSVFVSEQMVLGVTLDLAGNFYTGHIDEIRFTKGLARYTANYTPATVAFATYLVVAVPANILQGTLTLEGQIPGQSIQTILTPLELTLVGGKVEFAAEIIKQGILAFEGGVPGIKHGLVEPVLQGSIGWEGLKIGSVIVYPFQGELVIAGGVPGFGIPVTAKPAVSSRQFFMTLTGFNDGLPDVTIPISNMTTRLRIDGRSTVTIVVSNGVTYGVNINNRSNGTIIISDTVIYSNGSSETIVGEEYDIDTIRSSQGARNFSVVISGKTTVLNTQQKIVTLKGVSVITAQANGAKRVRSDVDISIFPGDVVILPDTTSLATKDITQVVSQRNMFMEVVDG